MARKIIYKNNGLNNQPDSPNGYKFVGYDNDTFSEKDGSVISAIGGSGGSNIIEKTYLELTTMISNSELDPGQLYLMTDSSQGDIWIKSLDVDTLSTEVQKLFYVIPNDYYDGTIGKGMFNAHNPVDVTSGEIYIWGARLWECTATATGVTPDDDLTLPAANFTMIPTSASTYNKVIMSCQYDIDNDWISKAYDWKGNELGIDYSNQSTLQHIDYNDWGDNGIYSNVCGSILNNEGSVDYLEISNNKGYYGIWNNDSGGDGTQIENNICGTISDNKNGYMFINSNIMDVKNSGISNNNGIDSAYIEIVSNYVSGSISNNTIPVTYGIGYNYNAGSIGNNTCDGSIYYNSNSGGIQANSNNGGIYKNSNNGHIERNTNNSGTTDIQFNTNNGYISRNAMNGSYLLEYNNNNGDIGLGSGFSTITRNADVTDTKVDK